MKIIIPTKGRAKTIRTHLLFKGENYYILVHNEDEYKAYVDNDTIDPDCIIISGVATDTYGLTRQREWAMEHLVGPGEWIIFADDNIRWITAVPEPWYWIDEIDISRAKYDKVWAARFRRKCPTDEFMAIADEMAEKAEGIGVHLCGLAAVENYFYSRTRHWYTVGYVIGKLMIEQNVGVPYRHDISMEDFVRTAEHLLRFGKVLINKFCRAHAGHYELGGMGKYEERIAVRKRDCQLIMQRYPGLFRLKKLKHMVYGTDLALRFYTADKVEAWRQSMRTPVLEWQE